MNPATSAPTTFPFPRSSPRASSPTNSDESSAYPSNITLDFHQEECFSGHYLHVSSSAINDQKGSDIIEEIWGE
jgi:hypothetical protein